MTPQSIFVYGTLKVGGRFARQFDDLRKSVVKGKIKGAMFSVHGSYPAVVPEGDNEIIGEVHTYDDAKMEEISARMDGIEGYRGQDNPNNLYNKSTVEVELEDGKKIEATTYFFNHGIEGLEKVADGVWPV